MVTDFYQAFAPVSFTLLGLWFIVVQTRHRDWAGSLEHRMRASGVGLHFALPGLMSLLSLIDPTNQALWRSTFGVSAALGVVGLVTTGRAGGGRPVLHWAAVGIFAVVSAVAVAPRLVTGMAPDAKPLQVEAFLLSLLLSLGVTQAWLLLFDDVAPLHEPVGDAPSARRRRG